MLAVRCKPIIAYTLLTVVLSSCGPLCGVSIEVSSLLSSPRWNSAPYRDRAAQRRQRDGEHRSLAAAHHPLGFISRTANPVPLPTATQQQSLPTGTKNAFKKTPSLLSRGTMGVSKCFGLHPSRLPLIAANWKCHPSRKRLYDIASMYNKFPVYHRFYHCEAVVAMPSCYFHIAEHQLFPSYNISAQDVSIENGWGAYTGEMSAKMVKDFKVHWTIVGHSERRRGFGGESIRVASESNEVVGIKAKNAVDEGLSPIVCVGEDLNQRAQGNAVRAVTDQLDAVRASLGGGDKGAAQWDRVVLAYEPVWAIGTGQTASQECIGEMHGEIRKWLTKNINSEVGKKTRILYGGSVKADNAQLLFATPDVDGFLVGGAALTADFQAILESARGPAAQLP